MAIAEILKEHQGVGKEVHTPYHGEFFPHLSRNTFPAGAFTLRDMSPISPDDLRQIFKINLEKAAQYQKRSGREIAKKGGVDAGTLRNAKKTANATNLRSIAGLAKGVGFEPWQLLVPGFDPRRPPTLHKRGALQLPNDQFTDMLLLIWSDLKPPERLKVLSRAQEVKEETGTPSSSDPPQMEQAIR